MNGILYMNVNLLKNEELFRKGMAMISQERQEKIQRFKNGTPARLSLGAGILLQIAMEKCGLIERLNDIKYGAYGKPYLPNSDFHFSLSHSGEYAICVYSYIPVGADLQKIKEKIPSHTKRILSETEHVHLNSLHEEEKKVLFYRLWAKKESLIKWDGRGLRLSLQDLSFIKNGEIINCFIFEEKTLYFKEYTAFLPEYSFCICSEEDSFPDKAEEITSEFLIKD